MNAVIQQAIEVLQAEHARIGAALEALRGISGSASGGTALERTNERTNERRRGHRRSRGVVRRRNVSAGPSRAVSRGQARAESLTPPANDDLTTKCLQALSDHGPASTGGLATRLKGTPFVVRNAMTALAEKGLVHRTGTGAQNFRWHLGAKGAMKPAAPAKEAP